MERLDWMCLLRSMGPKRERAVELEVNCPPIEEWNWWVMSRRLLCRGPTPLQQFLNCFCFAPLAFCFHLIKKRRAAGINQITHFSFFLSFHSLSFVIERKNEERRAPQEWNSEWSNPINLNGFVFFGMEWRKNKPWIDGNCGMVRTGAVAASRMAHAEEKQMKWNGVCFYGAVAFAFFF